MSKKIYSVCFNRLIPVNGSWFNNFEISEPGQEFRLLRVNFDFKYKVDAGAEIPIADARNVNLHLIIGDGSATSPVYTSNFSGFTDLPNQANDYNGTRIILYQPSERNFDDFFVSQKLPFRLECDMEDYVNPIKIWCTVIAEIEIIKNGIKWD